VGIAPELFDGVTNDGSTGASAHRVFKEIDKVLILACGTSYYSGCTAKYWLESIARMPTQVEIASEYRYRDSVPDPKTLVVTITQSGETADTLAALKHARSLGMEQTLTICNVATSAMVRECKLAYITRAGVEIGVASTKAFTCQLSALACLAIAAGRARGHMSEADEQNVVRALIEVPRLMAAALTLEPQVEKLAQNLAKARDVLYLGRGTSFPIALEGALKLKEISYIHAEGYAAGELKHGPIALIDETMPVIVIAPHDRVFEKTVSNMQEVAARGGKIILVTDPQGAREATVDSIETLSLPDMASTVTPLVYAIPVQLIAYHTATAIGTDVDQPRNLAKSVTVE
jgi:glucosamine--fructose-6-phosphate aminotransferase (isomerizing)